MLTAGRITGATGVEMGGAVFDVGVIVAGVITLTGVPGIWGEVFGELLGVVLRTVPGAGVVVGEPGLLEPGVVLTGVLVLVGVLVVVVVPGVVLPPAGGGVGAGGQMT
ncbi:MAG TPA: hypothetical protein VG388_05365 [Solirubrobacteraceae bacterium]|nr:hypothetical protein [Solirubrobacteraceae bacterium]